MLLCVYGGDMAPSGIGFGSRGLYTRVDVGGDLIVLKAAWASVKEVSCILDCNNGMSQEDMIS